MLGAGIAPGKAPAPAHLQRLTPGPPATLPAGLYQLQVKCLFCYIKWEAIQPHSNIDAEQQNHFHVCKEEIGGVGQGGAEMIMRLRWVWIKQRGIGNREVNKSSAG